MSRKEISDWTINYLRELDGLEKKTLTRRIGHEMWEPPCDPFIKINFDGAFNPYQERSSSEALWLGFWLGLVCVTIEDDSLTTIKKAKSISKDKFKIGAIVINIQQCKERFQRINFRHISRSGNSLAHHLAKASLKKGEDIYLVGGVSNYIRRAKERRQ
ncbi:hypothetical protein Gotri_021170 [Gossypium trilobum]|uniref:RNase H type-1 domain-containing protein n=1 Tax=Gossypium trilobum TaxID=34281 RepID=A0A7J9DC34_9ROSI|nr:hypothetical protein [Gossypium trilobum]